MESYDRALLYDSDHDVVRRSPPQLTVAEVCSQHRLIVNPLLSILCWLGAIELIGAGIRRSGLGLFLLGTALGLVAFALVQYYCLDCQCTGWLLRARRHACRGVIDRCLRRVPGPPSSLRVGTQIMLWSFTLLSLAGLYILRLLARG